MGSTTAERWAAMRVIHETFGVGAELLCRATGRSLSMVKRRIAAEGWTAPSAGRTAFLGRMSAMLEAQLEDLENQVSAGEVSDEKSARTLGTMARTWEKLNALEQLMDKELDERRRELDTREAGDTGATDDAGLHALRLELERRIAALVERKSAPGVSEQPVGGRIEPAGP